MEGRGRGGQQHRASIQIEGAVKRAGSRAWVLTS